MPKITLYYLLRYICSSTVRTWLRSREVKHGDGGGKTFSRSTVRFSLLLPPLSLSSSSSSAAAASCVLACILQKTLTMKNYFAKKPRLGRRKLISSREPARRGGRNIEHAAAAAAACKHFSEVEEEASGTRMEMTVKSSLPLNFWTKVTIFGPFKFRKRSLSEATTTTKHSLKVVREWYKFSSSQRSNECFTPFPSFRSFHGKFLFGKALDARGAYI